MEFYAYSSDEDVGAEYVIHNAAESGNVDLLKSLLEKKPSEPEPPLIEGQVPMPVGLGGAAPQEEFDLNLRDEDNCTPVHIAILHGQLEALQYLLEQGASAVKKCEGSPPLHMAVCVAAHKEHAAFVLPAIKLLLSHGAVSYDRDDHGRTALHWAAYLGLTNAMEALIEHAKEFAAEQQLNVVPVEGVEPPAPLPSLTEFQDKQGNTALHLAARYGGADALELLLNEAANGYGLPGVDAIKLRNKSGVNAMHLAAYGGNIECCRQLVAAAPGLLPATNRQGLNAAAIAAKRGHSALVPLFTAPGTDTKPAAGHGGKSKHTVLLAPPECLNHHTAPWPFVRGMPAPPPENVDRLTVLTKPGIGILRTCSFHNKLVWDEKPKKAAIGDILRVHDWPYVRKIQNFCEQIPETTSTTANLDGDTAVSNGTYAAALAAAGSVCHGVDEILAGKAKNVFCAVRPPGHHAGPGGVVTCRKDPHGSHGFCLFNNVAIGAAYAMTVHRHAGIKRTAILDFDVHHGNGTEACVANTAPSVEKYAFSTPYSEGVQQFSVYKPWHDVDDKDNVFFASVQGYGPKAPGVGAYVYPGSGATCDTRADADKGVDLAEMDLAPGEEPHIDNVDPDLEEDPDAEFSYQGGEMPRGEGPRIIDVGIPGPGSKVALWRRAWRDKIIPALVKFNPDFIFISAGFDAHKKDEINFNYIGVQEKDYEWLTDQLVQVANRCCEGRLVSVLEGGYRIQGGVVSAFARSVAAHVHAMAEENGQQWDPRDAKWEREHEKQLRAEAEAKRAAALAADWARAQAAAAAATAQVASPPALVEGTAPAIEGAIEMVAMDTDVAAVPVAAAAVGDGEDEDAGGRRKRRRGSVDYIALNKQLEAEKAKAAGGSQPPAKAE